MKVAHPYACDGCGKARARDANNWWILQKTLGGRERFWAEKWSDSRAKNEDVSHVCGQECAMKLFERWLETGSFEAPSSRKLEEQGNEPV